MCLLRLVSEGKVTSRAGTQCRCLRYCSLCCFAGSADHTVQLWGSKSAESQETSTADSASPVSLLRTFQTKATPVFYVHFTPMNLLIGSGALTLRQ